MPNTKTGTTWAPDIRPEKIETFEETYTPEGGEQQIIEYRAVNHHPILNKVLDKMAFFRTHVGAIWYNLAERKTLLTKLNELDAELREVNAKMESELDYEQAISISGGFTAQQNGYLLGGISGNAGQGLRIITDEIDIYYGTVAITSNYAPVSIPITKGKTYTTKGSANLMAHFIPFKS